MGNSSSFRLRAVRARQPSCASCSGGSAAGILDLGHFARTARHGARRRGLRFPLARRIPPGGRRRAFRRVGGGLCRHLLRHAAQRTRPHLGERAYHSATTSTCSGGINLKRIFGADACCRLHHAAVDRGAGTPARTSRHRCSEVITEPGSQSGVRTDQGARIRPRRRQRRAGHGRGGGRTHRARTSTAKPIKS